MFGVEILEVAIGLALTFLLLSTVVSAGIELVKRVTQMKPKTQIEALRILLDEKQNDPNSFVSRFKNQVTSKVDEKLGKFPKIDSAADYAKALLSGSAEIPFDQWRARVEADISRIPNEQVRAKLGDLLEKLEDNGMGKIHATKERVAEWAGHLSDWYGTAMTNAGEWFVKQTRWFSLLLSLVIVVIFNADCIKIAKTLWNDQELREATVSAADAYTQQVFSQPATGTEGDIQGFVENINKLESAVSQAKDLPMGWSTETWPQDDPNFKDRVWLWWMYKVLGLVFTSLAVSMGSATWYRIMKDLLKLRSAATGKGGEQTQAVPQTTVIYQSTAQEVAPNVEIFTPEPGPEEFDESNIDPPSEGPEN